MKARQILDHASHRLRQPGAWGAVLLFASAWNLVRWTTGPERFPPGEFFLPLALGALTLILSATPWQWTGDERPQAPFLRGLVQAIPWSLLTAATLTPLLTCPPGCGSPACDTPGLLPQLSPRMWALLAAGGAFSLFAGWILSDRDKEAQAAAAQMALAREAQTRALQAQMNPHVLFNILGSLAELAHEGSPATEGALVDLAHLLRRLMDHAARPVVPLSEERDLIEALLALERIRLGERLRITWTWDESLEDLEVPPLLLQPLVENALKHGIAPAREGGSVEIGLAGTPARIRLWVANSGRPLQSNRTPGKGLDNLRQRLALIHPGHATLDLRSEGERTLADLILEGLHV